MIRRHLDTDTASRAKMGRPIIPTLGGAPMLLSALMSDWLLHLARVEGYAASTLENYERTKLQLLAFLRTTGRRDEVPAFTDAACEEFVRSLGDLGCGVNTIVNKLAALSSFATYGMRARNPRTGRPWLATNPTKAFKWPVTRRANVPILAPAVIHAFLSVPLAGSKAMIRDLLMDTGLRASEIAGANAEDLLRIGSAWFLEVTVKSRGRHRRRQFPVSTDVATRLSSYLASRGPLPDGAPLIVRKDGQRYSRSHIGRVVALIGLQAGIRGRVGPHRIRHMCNVWGRLGGADALSRSALLGHSSPASIQSYEHVLDHELHQARARQRVGLRQYLEGFDVAGAVRPPTQRPDWPPGGPPPVCATPENAGGVAKSLEHQVVDLLGRSENRTAQDLVKHVNALARLGYRDSGQSRKSVPQVEVADLCRCGASAAEHDYRVAADDRLVGCSLVSDACEQFEAA